VPDFRNLDVWKKSIDLSLEVYRLTKKFPKDELFVLTSQMRRCSNSIPSNIAEGSSNRSKLDFKRFLNIALGSSFELETQLLLSFKLGYMADTEYTLLSETLNHIQRMLQNLIKSI
jgi:four helix bundle protein